MKISITGVSVALAATLSLLFLSAGAVRATEPASFTVTASNWSFTPGTIVAHVGVPVTLHMSSKEGVHGIKSDALGIAETTLLPGKTVTVTFTPKKAGTYKISCAIPCGPGHATMTFTVTVEE